MLLKCWGFFLNVSPEEIIEIFGMFISKKPPCVLLGEILEEIEMKKKEKIGSNQTNHKKLVGKRQLKQ